MSSPIDEHFFARLRVCNDSFAASLPDVLQRLACLLAGKGEGTPLPPQGAELAELLHLLAGCAATFGYRRLGHDARGMEQRLRVLLAFPAAPAGDWSAWLSELDALVTWARVNPKAGYTTADLIQ